MGQIQLQRELVKRTLARLDSAKAGKELNFLLGTGCITKYDKLECMTCLQAGHQGWPISQGQCCYVHMQHFETKMYPGDCNRLEGPCAYADERQQSCCMVYKCRVFVSTLLSTSFRQDSDAGHHAERKEKKSVSFSAMIMGAS